MPRAPRFAPGGYVYHALNRAVARLPLFEKAGDFDAFERVLLHDSVLERFFSGNIALIAPSSD
jgi:hypothetical protein